MRIPVWLLRLLPMWDYICPKCKKEVEKNSHKCPYCGERYGQPIRIPPKVLKDPKTLEDYVHKHVFPRVSRAQRDYLAQYFTEIFSDGFESGDFSEWTGTVADGGTNTVTSTNPHNGTYCYESNLTSEADLFAYKTISRAIQQLNIRAYVKIVTAPSGNGFWLGIRDDADSKHTVFLGTSGTSRYLYLRYLDNSGAHTDTSATSFPNDGSYHCLELQFIPSSSDASYKVFLDGTEVTDLRQTGLNANYYSDIIYVGAHVPFSSYTSGVIKFDDVVVADTYIGPEVEVQTYTKTWATDVLFKKLGIIVGDERKSIVESDTSTKFATQATFQRKTFYANGRFWVFYAKNYTTNQLVYRTSTDGTSWSSETVIRSGDYGPLISVFFDGTYVHYASTGTGSYPYESALYYRRGVPNSDGTITWSAPEQTVNTNSNEATNPAIAVDSNGYVWIGYREYVNGSRRPFVIKSGNNDGTWGTTPSGFPYQLSTTESLSWAIAPIPLTNGKMLIVYAYHLTDDYGKQIKMKAWNGSSWLDEVTTPSGIYHSMHYSAVAEGDEVHIVFWKFTSTEDPMEIVYVKYSYSSNSLGSETTLQGSIPYTETFSEFSAPIISGAPEQFFVFWANYPDHGHIYYRKWNGSSWEDRVDWIDESSEMFSSDSWTCFYQAYDGYVGVLYETKQSSPYNIKFACMPRVVTVDVLFKKLGIARTFGADSAFKKPDITKSLAAGATFQKQDIPKIFGLDAAFQKSLIIQKQIDILFKRFDVLKSFAVDVRFGALMTQTIVRQIDVLLKKLDATATFGLDTYFGPAEAETYAKNFGLTVIFAYKVRLPELWLDENGKIVLNVSKPYTWVGT